MHLKKSLIALALTSTLAACGGSSSSTEPVVTPAPEPQNISGTASKGLILGGTVTAYLINTDGTKGDSVGTATTDATDGSYELTLDTSYNGEALIIEITATDGSQMKCDLSVCLADDDDEIAITFGELYTLPSDFELSAVSSGSDSDTISINVTPLTNIAAALTLDKVASGAVPADAAEASNYQIADLLGLDGDVTELPIVDLTDADAINAASADSLEANLKSAAVVEAALNDSSEGTSIEDALAGFVTQYVDANGIADTEGADVDTASVSLEEIAEASQALTSTIVTELEGVSAEDENIAAVETALVTEETEAATGSTEPSQGDVPDDIGSEGLLAAKAFVSQVSTFNLATQLDSANAFEDKISLASDLVSSDFDAGAEALSLATAAIAEAFIAYNEAAITTYQSGNINVAVSVDGDTVTYTVAQTLDVVDSAGIATATTIDLTAVNAVFSNTIEEAETENVTENPYSETYTWNIEGEASLDLAISGSVSTDLVSISIDDGSHFIATLTTDEEEAEQYSSTEAENSGSWSWSETASGLISVSDVDIALSVTIAQVASTEVTDPIAFTGELNLAATLLSIDYDESGQDSDSSSYTSTTDESTGTTSYTSNQSGSYSDSGTEIITIDGFTASLSGMFSNSTDSIEASLAAAVSGLEETCTWAYESSYTYTDDNGTVDSSDTNSESGDCNLTGETAETYASASINVRFAIDVDGINDDVTLEAAIQRTGLESGVASIDLSYGGNQLDFDFDTDDIVEEGEGDTTITTTSTATLTNHNGVVLTVTLVETDYVDDSTNSDTVVTTGVITYEGEEFATVSEDGIVTFSDGTFVSL